MNASGRGHTFDDPLALERLFVAYRSGVGMAELGRRYRVDHTSILYQLQKHGVWVAQLRPRKPRRAPTMRRARPPGPTRRSLDPEAPVPKEIKYQHLLEEGFYAGKDWRDYQRAQKRQAARAKSDREALMKRLRAEKVSRDKAIASGKIPRPDRVVPFGDFAATPVW